MSFKNEQGIVPQLGSARALSVLTKCISAFTALGLSACAHVNIPLQTPKTPSTLEEARAYINGRDAQLQILEYELNQQTIACYDHFFVSRCLDDVRLQGARLRRAHLEVQGHASDMIRLNDYNKRRATIQPVQPVK